MDRRAPLTRRSRLRRGKALPRGKGFDRRRRPLPRSNPERRARRYKRDFGGDVRRRWVSRQPCATCGAKPPSDNSHVRSRGAGGRASDVIPQCRRCHRELHDVGRRTFEARHGVDLEELARETDRRWKARGRG